MISVKEKLTLKQMELKEQNAYNLVKGKYDEVTHKSILSLENEDINPLFLQDLKKDQEVIIYAFPSEKHMTILTQILFENFACIKAKLKMVYFDCEKEEIVEVNLKN